MGCCVDDDVREDHALHDKPRSCTDVLWLIFFIAFVFLLIFIASFAFVYGNPLRLLNGYDSFGNTCGTAQNEKVGNLKFSGLNTIDKPFLFFMDIKNVRDSMKVCVKMCPTRNLYTLSDVEKFFKETGSMLCRYNYSFNEFNAKIYSKDVLENAVTQPLGPCPSLPVFGSDPILRRCIPRSVKEVSSLIVNNLYEVLNSWDALEQILADLYASWKEILALSFLAFVLSLIMVSILHLLASVVAWIFMIIVSIAAVGGTTFLWWTYIGLYKQLNDTPKELLLEESVHNEQAFLLYSVMATIFTVIILLLVFVMRKRIKFLAALFEDSASCLGDIPFLFVQPLITFIALLAYFAFWVSVIVCLATSTYPGVKALHPFLDFQGDSGNVPNTNNSRLGLKKFTFVEFVDPAWVRYFWWIYLIGLVWISEFILACQQMVIAGAVSMWYFNRRSANNIFPVLSSINKLICYHFGSVAKGSFLITIFKVPRIILTYLYVKLKGGAEDNCCVRCGLKCCICCFYCFENFIRYMNHNAYTVIAMEGVGFCAAAKIAFSALGSNALRLLTVNSVGDFILFLGKCFVTAVTGCVGLIFLKQDPHLHFYAVPTLVVCIFAFFIAHCVLSLYEMVIDTMFICVCEDERLHPEGDPEKLEKECQCDDCKKKKIILRSNEPWKGTKQLAIKMLIVLGWSILALLAYKVSQFDYEYANFDPYEILSVPPGASQADIKKSYRKLSLIFHPDKETGDEKKFMKLTKAYQALTDDEARRNWEKYGNPDGPGAMSFGIALPSWIIEKENSVWVLGLYALVFMVALPTIVGMWWYKSIRYSGEQVLLDTSQMYYYFFHKTPSMAMKRVIMVLAASLEFEKKHNSEIVERPSDNEEVPQLIKQIPNLSEKNRERPLCYLYSIKARALLHAHLNRIPLKADTLDKDRQYVVKKCPYLIQEMVNCVSQLIILAYARRIPRLPNIETIENCMKLCPMIVQGLWEYKNPLLQLPYVTEDNIRHFVTKKRHIKTIQQFAQLKNEERRSVLKHLTDDQYKDVMKVMGKMPYIDFQVRSEVIDDENPTVYTAGAIVTVTVTLVRKDMSVLFGDDSVSDKHLISLQENEDDNAEEQNKKELVKRPVWQKQQKKGKKAGKKGSKPQKQQNKSIPARKSEDKAVAIAESSEIARKNAGDGGDDSDFSDDEAERSADDEDDESKNSQKDNKGSAVEDDDTEWEKFQSPLTKREKVLEGRSKLSHSVHCPLFPEDKQEYWWVYISDRKSHTLLTPPYHVTALVEEEEIQLKFTAPRWPNLYTFTVCLRSDSYLGFDQMHDIKLDVKEAPEVPTEHPQWDMLDDEEEQEEGQGSDISEFTTDEDVEDEH